MRDCNDRSTPATSGVSRRTVLGVAAGTALAAPAVLGRKAQARDKKLVFWLLPNFNKTADEQMIAQTMAFARQAGLKDGDVEIAKVPGSELNKRLAAAVEVGSPPDVVKMSEQNFIQWLPNLLDLSDIVTTMRGHPGGVNESATRLVEVDGRHFAAPMGINPEVGHTRMDVLRAAGLDAFPTTWEGFIDAMVKVTKPPFYGYGMTLGMTSDTLWEISSVLWAYGGALVDKDGRPAFDSPGSVAAFKLIDEMYNKAKIIPRGALSWDNAANNKAFESGQVAYTVNPPSIYANVIENKAPFAADVGLYRPPGGPAGRFGSLYADYYAAFKQAPAPELAKGLIAAFLAPNNYRKFIEDTEGRYFPVYSAMADDPFWTAKPIYKDLLEIVRSGNTVFWPGQLTPAIAEVTALRIPQKHLQNVLVNRQSPADAVKATQAEMVEIYKRLGEPT